MSTSSRHDDVDSGLVQAPVVTFDPEDFPEHVERLMDQLAESAGTRLLFYGGIREQRQQALGTITRYATGNVHQFRVPSLLSEYRMQTQNNLRKAFDHAAEESALLYFDKADPIFTHSHADTPDDPSENAIPSTAEYFFDRVQAYGGVVVLGLQRKRHVELARNRVHVIVKFE